MFYAFLILLLALIVLPWQHYIYCKFMSIPIKVSAGAVAAFAICHKFFI